MKKADLLVTLASALLLFAGSAQADTTYYGELCWLAGVSGEEDSSIIKLAVSDMGDGHVYFNGRSIGDDPQANPELFSGNGEIVGNNVVLMLSNAYDDDNEFGSGKFYAKISLSTLSGTFTGLLQQYNKQLDEFETEYGGGFFNAVACP